MAGLDGMILVLALRVEALEAAEEACDEAREDV